MLEFYEDQPSLVRLTVLSEELKWLEAQASGPPRLTARKHVLLEELLTHFLQKADGIDTFGRASIRATRKRLIVRAQSASVAAHGNLVETGVCGDKTDAAATATSTASCRQESPRSPGAFHDFRLGSPLFVVGEPCLGELEGAILAAAPDGDNREGGSVTLPRLLSRAPPTAALPEDSNEDVSHPKTSTIAAISINCASQKSPRLTGMFNDVPNAMTPTQTTVQAITPSATPAAPSGGDSSEGGMGTESVKTRRKKKKRPTGSKGKTRRDKTSHDARRFMKKASSMIPTRIPTYFNG